MMHNKWLSSKDHTILTPAMMYLPNFVILEYQIIFSTSYDLILSWKEKKRAGM